MLFDFPKKAEVNRNIPKSKFYERARPSAALKSKFVRDIAQVIWSYKLAPETINLHASDGVQEVQVFTVMLKADSIDESVLRAIDKAIPSPIIFEIHRAKDAKSIAAYKRSSDSDASSWVVEDYLESSWVPTTAFERAKLPVALNMASLYEKLLMGISSVASRQTESLHAFIERYATIRSKRSEMVRISAKLKSEKQFNKKVELNAKLRELTLEIDLLSDRVGEINQQSNDSGYE